MWCDCEIVLAEDMFLTQIILARALLIHGDMAIISQAVTLISILSNLSSTTCGVVALAIFDQSTTILGASGRVGISHGILLLESHAGFIPVFPPSLPPPPPMVEGLPYWCPGSLSPGHSSCTPQSVLVECSGDQVSWSAFTYQEYSLADTLSYRQGHCMPEAQCPFCSCQCG